MLKEPLQALTEILDRDLPEGSVEAAFGEMVKRIEEASRYDVHIASLFSSRDAAIRRGDYESWTREHLYLAIAFYMLKKAVRWEKACLDVHARTVLHNQLVDSIGE